MTYTVNEISHFSGLDVQ